MKTADWRFFAVNIRLPLFGILCYNLYQNIQRENLIGQSNCVC